ncbi:MAG: TonB C-terminal domain-containing protein [Deltaproteobacteria bacterium]|nr:TonB C-terminal domain-containing protein [Deltaproteobacteria bacterium]
MIHLKRPLIISLILHLACLVFILFVPKIEFKTPKRKVVWVELPKGSSEEIQLQMKESENLPKTTIQEQKEILKEPVKEKEKPMIQPTPPKKPALRPIQSEPAPKKPKQKTAVEKALEALNKKRPAPPEAAQVKDKGEGFKYGTGTEPLRVLPTDPEYLVYQAKVRAKIMDEWILPTTYLEGPSKPRAGIVLMINQQGEIISTEWDEKSGNPAFDASCLRAVQRASPLPIPTARLQWETYNEGFMIQFDPALKAR